jgi:hypothetical protein
MHAGCFRNFRTSRRLNRATQDIMARSAAGRSMNPRSVSNTSLRRVVIVGAGSAGVASPHKLASASADILVIDRHNYNLFQPLLYQVATAGVPGYTSSC